MISVHFIFNQLDDGQKKIGVSEPAEYIINTAQILHGEPLRHLSRKWGEDHNRDVHVPLLDDLGEFKRILI
ncbi:hypothetical protein DSECCO2_523160 [anaerobic digester metagenome]